MTDLKCWNCGAALNDIPLPISRQATCGGCFNELHCCRLCAHYDPSNAADQCAEDRADPPVIKESANFCEWFEPHALRARAPEERDAARSRLDALFGASVTKREGSADDATENPKSAPLSSEDKARVDLDRLFSTRDPSSEGDENTD